MAPGGELFDLLTEAVTFSEKRTKRTMRQIVRGVAHVHAHGIVHRDLKVRRDIDKSGASCKRLIALAARKHSLYRRANGKNY